jgi:hypothetical protein
LTNGQKKDRIINMLCQSEDAIARPLNPVSSTEEQDAPHVTSSCDEFTSGDGRIYGVFGKRAFPSDDRVVKVTPIASPTATAKWAATSAGTALSLTVESSLRRSSPNGHIKTLQCSAAQLAAIDMVRAIIRGRVNGRH